MIRTYRFVSSMKMLDSMSRLIISRRKEKIVEIFTNTERGMNPFEHLLPFLIQSM
jgi:hypothetical protein